jgi:hypothetical protein
MFAVGFVGAHMNGAYFIPPTYASRATLEEGLTKHIAILNKNYKLKATLVIIPDDSLDTTYKADRTLAVAMTDAAAARTESQNAAARRTP